MNNIKWIAAFLPLILMAMLFKPAAAQSSYTLVPVMPSFDSVTTDDGGGCFANLINYTASPPLNLIDGRVADRDIFGNLGFCHYHFTLPSPQSSGVNNVVGLAIQYESGTPWNSGDLGWNAGGFLGDGLDNMLDSINIISDDSLFRCYSDEIDISGLGCDIVSDKWIDTYDTTTDGKITVGVHNGDVSQNNDYSGYFQLFWIVQGQPSPPVQGDDWGRDSFSYSCIFSQEITLSDGVTQTVQASADTNLVYNDSFEIGSFDGFAPDGWIDFTENATPWFDSWTTDRPNSGAYAIMDTATADQNNKTIIRQVTNTYEPSGLYMMGVALRSDDGTLGNVTFNLNGDTSVSVITTTYKTYTTTTTLSQGEHAITISLDNAIVDDVYLLPIDENFNLRCESGIYPPVLFNEDNECISTGSTVCLPAPTGTSETCYLCQPPTGPGAIGNIGYWIAWLGCIIRNLFNCGMRLWLLDINNSVMGVVSYFDSYVFWLYENSQAGVNWFADSVVPVIGGTTVIVTDAGTNLIDLFIAILGFIVDIISILINAVLQIIELLISMATAVIDGFSVGAANPDLLGNGSQVDDTIVTALLDNDGPNDSKILFLIIMPLIYIDQLVADFGALVLLLDFVMALAGLFIIIRITAEWKELISF